MADATISRARLRDLARPGRSRLPQAGQAGPQKTSALRRRALADASSIAECPSAQPEAASSRPETGDLMESTI